MSNLIAGINFLGIPMTIAVVLVCLFLILQVIGEILSFKGKIVPEFINIRKYFKRKKDEKEEMTKTLNEVKQLLAEVNNHYSADNITKRNEWMQWVNDRAKTYDTSIEEITKTLDKATRALEINTNTTEEMFVESSRDRIIDFAERASDNDAVLSHEQFRRIFRVYECYEKFLEEHNRTNGEITIAYEMIQEGYKHRLQNHCFVEDVRKHTV